MLQMSYQDFRGLSRILCDFGGLRDLSRIMILEVLVGFSGVLRSQGLQRSACFQKSQQDFRCLTMILEFSRSLKVLCRILEVLVGFQRSLEVLRFQQDLVVSAGSQRSLQEIVGVQRMLAAFWRDYRGLRMFLVVLVGFQMSHQEFTGPRRIFNRILAVLEGIQRSYQNLVGV